MTSLAAVRTAVANQLATIPGLRASAVIPGQVTPPMAVVRPGPSQVVQFDTDDGSIAYGLTVTLLVSYTEDTASQAALDAYLDSSGSGSVIGALKADPTLGGAVAYCVPVSASGYGLISYAGQDYFGAHLALTAVV